MTQPATSRRMILGAGLAVAAPRARAAEPPPAVFLLPETTIGDAIAAEFAKVLTLRAAVPVKALLSTGFADAPTNAAGQVDGEALLGRLQPVADRVRRLYDAPDALLIAITRRDLNGSGGTRFLFSIHNFAAKLSAVSSARVETADTQGKLDQAALITRLYKLLLRAIGEQVLHLPRSTDPRSLMYAPLLSVADLDLIGESFGPAI